MFVCPFVVLCIRKANLYIINLKVLIERYQHYIKFDTIYCNLKTEIYLLVYIVELNLPV